MLRVFVKIKANETEKRKKLKMKKADFVANVVHKINKIIFMNVISAI